MARKVFFSFHYERDAWRVSQVRNSNVIHNFDKTPFLDHADWEKIQRQGKASISRWIDNQLNGSSVTIVLIGNQTYTRPWVSYEIQQSWQRGNGLLGIYIHGIRDQHQQIDAPGINPFTRIDIPGTTYTLNRAIKSYDWVEDNGRENLAKWIENAVASRKTF